MWPWKKNKPGTTKTGMIVAVRHGYSDDDCNVYSMNGNLIIKLYGSWLTLQKSLDGETANAKDIEGKTRKYIPLTGWTNAELREYGFNVPSDDGIVPQEVQLARAVLAGDKAAAAALADWVTENWSSK